MIELLGEKSYSNSDMIGEKILTLSDLKIKGLNIVETIIITNELFKNFQKNGFIEEEKIKKIFKLLINIGFSEEDIIYFQTSSKIQCNGIMDNVKGSLSLISIKNSLENIFNSWSSDRARAFRVANFISDENSLPAVFIQKFYNNLNSIITRTADGEVTSSDNYNSNIQNKIDFFNPYFNKIFPIVELVYKKPAKIFFTVEKTTIKICNISDQNITPVGNWIVLSELYSKEVFDDITLISNIKPYMIGRYLGLRMIPQNVLFMLNGMPASPGYAIGELIFNTTFSFNSRDKLLNAGRSFICAFFDFGPDDFNILENYCVGSFSTSGGMTSHLAVTSRGLGIPTVTGIKDLEIDNKNRIIKIESKIFSEFSNIAIDGTNGKWAILKDESPFEEIYEIPYNEKKYVYNIIDLLNRVSSNQHTFSKLPINAQMHIATLKNHIRKLGY